MKYVMFRCVAKTKIVVLKSAAAQTCQVLVHCLRGDSIYTTKMPWMVVWVGNYVAMNFMTAACNRDGFYVFKLPCASMRVCMSFDTKRWMWQRLKMVEPGWLCYSGMIWIYMSIDTIRVDIGNMHYYTVHGKFHPFVFICVIFEYMATWSPAKRSELETYRWQAQKDEGRIFSSHSQGMLLWSLKSWQHKCNSTSWLYKTHKQEVMHKLGSKHNIQSWVAFSLGHDSYSRSQCTQKKFTFLHGWHWQTLFGLVWYRPTILYHASNHILEPDAKCFCDCRVPSHFRKLSVVHESEIFVALKREAYKDLNVLLVPEAF